MSAGERKRKKGWCGISNRVAEKVMVFFIDERERMVVGFFWYKLGIISRVEGV